MSFSLETMKTFVFVELGRTNEQIKGPFMVWFSASKPTSTTLPDGVTITNEGRLVTITYKDDACFVVRKYVG